MQKNVLILSPHTDDAELGCGATIVRLLEEGANIMWLVFSTAEESLPKDLPKDTLKREFEQVAVNLGLDEKQYRIRDFRVRYLHEKRQDVLELLVATRDEFHPDLVIGPSLNDFHQDHTVVANEMVRAFKSKTSIICYELPWNTVSFNTQLFFPVTEQQMQRKCELLQSYRSQTEKGRPYFSETFVKGLARTRGVQVSAEYAEAFEVVRWIQ